MTGKLVTRLSVAAASALTAVAMFGATPALASDIQIDYPAAEAAAQQAAADGNYELAQQIEQQIEAARQADQRAAGSFGG
ncbi:hypothetical protein ACIRYZ_44175 [Kitasatospora sp. NPDC101155]|uniref:hypothetical protein n=1 Tax=Kitasatospora sp. NPDC101155 TaxID=3364097 RepID=UPI0038032FA0